MTTTTTYPRTHDGSEAGRGQRQGKGTEAARVVLLVGVVVEGERREGELPPGAAGCPEFDPAWEYFAPDPYVEWAVYGHRPRAACGFDALFDIDTDEGWSRHRHHGLRFGRGKPDGFWGRLAPDPDKRKAPREVLQPVKCKGCGRTFQPGRSGVKHCSNECYRRPGRARELPESVECSACGKAFRPAWTGNLMCSRACAARLGGSKALEIDAGLFTSLWESGASRAAIGAALNISEATVKRWVRRLGLKKRPVGNRSGRGRDCEERLRGGVGG